MKINPTTRPVHPAGSWLQGLAVAEVVVGGGWWVMGMVAGVKAT